MTGEVFSVVNPVAGAVVGGIATYLVTVGVQRARPRIALQGCTVASSYARKDIPASFDADLLVKCELTPEIGVVLDRNQQIDENSYVMFLTEAAADLDFHINRRESFTRSVAELQKALNAKQWTRFADKWANDSYMLWQPLVVSFGRGQFSFDSPRPGPEDAEIEKRISEREGNVLVSHGGRRIEFFYDPDDDTDSERGFARQAALALLTGNVADLQALVNQLDTYTNETRLDHLQQKVSGELLKFARVVVTGHVTNTGRLPCSLNNRANLVIKAEGETGSANSNGKPAPPSTYEKDLNVTLMFAASNADSVDYDTPVAIPAGGLIPFVAFSEEPLAQLKEGADIERLLGVGILKAYLGYQVARPGTSELKVEYSDDFIFANSAKLQTVPARPSGWPMMHSLKRVIGRSRARI